MPTIDFSDRLHQLIDKKLKNSVVVRLLGRSIGYSALLSRIKVLWRPVGEISLVDLDNDYFLVRFAKEKDCLKVLTGGPWVVYGCYLTVQPWSWNFSINRDHPEQIVVWARLPGLAYQYYTKSIFRMIAGLMGRIIRIDYNTEEGKRGRFARLTVVVDLSKPLVSSIIIDGKRQKIEYEGLPMICYHCGRYGHLEERCLAPVEEPPSRYGPWMQVNSRRNRRNVVRKEGERAGDGALSRVIADNRFDVLNVEDDNVVVQNGGAVKMSSIPSASNVLRPTTGLSGNNGKAVVVTSGEAVDVWSATASAIKDVGQTSGSTEVSLRGNGQDDSLEKDDRALEVASDGVVVSVPVTLNPSNNVAVRVLNKTTVGERVVSMEENMAAYDELASMDQIKERRLTKVKGSARRTPYPSRRAATVRIENVGPTKVHIGEWVEGMTRELR
ncbi:hypothetical protein GQ457_05G027470 [Hibiscus cannabinus]